MKKSNILLLLGIALVLIDIITKHLFYGKKEAFITSLTNKGGIFGFFDNSFIFILVLSFVCLFLLIYYYSKIKSSNQRLALIFVISGIIGNFIDRLIFGYTRDFIDLKIWPVFNLADAFTTIGVILFIIFLFKGEKHAKFSHTH
ncbi:MAG: signal peptidase II [Nanoarchaeota archaeon]